MSKQAAAWLRAARDAWAWRGSSRPELVVVPGPGQESVWDYPRPPRLEREAREVCVHWGARPVARTQRAWRVLETAHPPSLYIPWEDIDRALLQPGAGSSLCEWKGAARYWDLVHGADRLDGVAWSYAQPLAGAEALADCVAFYPAALDCRVGGAVVRPQPGGFYGGWITPELVGPFKGDAHSAGW